MNRAALTLGLALMDVCWVYPWAVLLGIWSDPRRNTGLLSALIILALLLVSALGTHLVGKRLGRGRHARVVLAVLAVAASLVAVRIEHYSGSAGLDWIPPFLGALAATIGQLTAPVLAFAVAVYLFYRGVRLGSQTPGFTEVEGAFRWGIARLAVFGVVSALSRGAEAQTLPFVVAFFFVSLLTLALGRLESLRTRTRRPTMNTQWLAVLVVVAASVVLLALLLGQIVSFDVLLVATRPVFDVLGMLLLLLVYIVVIPLAYVVQWIVYLVLSLLQADARRPPPQLPQPSDVDNALQRFFAQTFTPEMIEAMKAVGAALLLVIALLIVVRGLSRWRPSSADADASNEERDSMMSARDALARLLAWLRGLLRRSPRVTPGLAAVPTQPGLTSTEVSPDTVRALYAHLLRIAETCGVGRAPATTPSEHLPAVLAALQPETPVRQVTAAYLRVRYAEEQTSTSEIMDLRQQLSEVHPIGATD